MTFPSRLNFTSREVQDGFCEQLRLKKRILIFMGDHEDQA